MNVRTHGHLVEVALDGNDGVTRLVLDGAVLLDSQEVLDLDERSRLSPAFLDDVARRIGGALDGRARSVPDALAAVYRILDGFPDEERGRIVRGVLAAFGIVERV